MLNTRQSKSSLTGDKVLNFHQLNSRDGLYSRMCTERSTKDCRATDYNCCFCARVSTLYLTVTTYMHGSLNLKPYDTSQMSRKRPGGALAVLFIFSTELLTTLVAAKGSSRLLLLDVQYRMRAPQENFYGFESGIVQPPSRISGQSAPPGPEVGAAGRLGDVLAGSAQGWMPRRSLGQNLTNGLTRIPPPRSGRTQSPGKWAVTWRVSVRKAQGRKHGEVTL